MLGKSGLAAGQMFGQYGRRMRGRRSIRLELTMACRQLSQTVAAVSGSEPFRLLSSPSLDAAMLLLVSQAMAASNQAAHASSRMASRTLARD